MEIFDSYSKDRIHLPEKDNFSIYVCGITPYDAAHVGHIATYTYFDVLIRHLELNHKTKVKYVQNITDVDDSIIEFAKRKNTDVFDLAIAEEKKLLDVFEKMSIRFPNEMPKVTSSIESIIDKVEELYSNDFLYSIEDDWFFDITKIDDFGKNTGLSQEVLYELFNERGGDTRLKGKKNPLDFLVWSKYREGEPSWESKLGKGRPGWHIECSAMLMEHFDTPIDIHGGGEDLYFPHHICEQAQCSALGIENLSNLWMHTALVSINGEKMSKSSQNLVYVDGLLKDFSPNSIKISILRNHFQDNLDWSNAMPKENEKLASLIEQTVALAPNKIQMNFEISKQVQECLDDNLDTPGAIDIIEDVCNIFSEGFLIHPSDREDLIFALNVLGLVPR